jgi:hypothetical protein
MDTLESLMNKRILLLAPKFFGYEAEIRNELERRGAIVDWLQDRPFDRPAMTALAKLNSQLTMPFVDRLHSKMINQYAASEYNIILVVNGQTLSDFLLSKLRASYPRANLILYMWDSLSNRPLSSSRLSRFDNVYTFDPQDAEKYQMKLRPLFYGAGYGEKIRESDSSYDISFIGTAHTDRYSIVHQIKSALPKGINAYWYLYLQAPWVLNYYRITNAGIRYAPSGEFNFYPLKKEAVRSIFSKSKSVLDIEHPNQNGLTMRTFETIGSCKKLVTTNADIKNYDFYSENNIHVINRSKPYIPEEFFRTSFVPIAKEIQEKYTISSWINEILGLKN